MGTQAQVSGPKEYYGSQLQNLLHSPQITKTQVKSYLNNTLKHYHKPQLNQPDEILKNCNTSDCYRQRLLSYKKARKFLFGFIDLLEDQEGFFVISFYCRVKFHAKNFLERPPKPGGIPNTSIINTEHLWPQSQFSRQAPRELQKSDLHHLQITISSLNSMRGNKIFGKPQNIHQQLCQGIRIGEENKQMVFQPPPQQAGNIARSLFYFSIRYNMNISKQEEEHLRQWHIEDPVDEEEKERHETLAQFQRNRNPFIDYPQLVDRIHDF